MIFVIEEEMLYMSARYLNGLSKIELINRMTCSFSRWLYPRREDTWDRRVSPTWSDMNILSSSVFARWAATPPLKGEFLYQQQIRGRADVPGRRSGGVCASCGANIGVVYSEETTTYKVNKKRKEKKSTDGEGYNFCFNSLSFFFFFFFFFIFSVSASYCKYASLYDRIMHVLVHPKLLFTAWG